MSVDIGALTDRADLWAAQQVFRTAMVGVPLLDPAAADGLNEPGRTFGARVGGELVGTANSYTSWLVVPGGERLPHAAVTHVGVLPTHARQGIASALLRHQLTDIAERGEIVATLRATQGGIYERFGYGIAGSAARLEIDRRRVRFRDTVPESGPVRLLAPADIWEVPAKIYATAGVSWVGAIDRPPQWWRLLQVKGDRGHVAVHGDPGAEDGFVRYHGAESAAWARDPKRTVVVDDLVATTPTAYLGLIRHLLAADIVDSVVIPMAAPDAPLRHLLTDERAVTVTDIRDETWLRLVDVAAALRRRAYKPGAPVVLAVTDPILPANNTRLRVAGSGVVATDAPADLSTDIATLGAAYLGGTSWRHMALAGRVTEHRPGAAAVADALFAVQDHPFSGTYF
ncbi:GNAT family N-acetyltransferase [Nocardia speluncae]|uniref:GNAT family N-acetyltransferase n=1 Tax=Nocardia speluncae TaxID=419477 RepID=A0A846XFQ4_9NOCA|nr:GNAT family N-acetyltransferase [Nocardia speluncae]NKY33443.1 GNAT family N-acetyltransferase [Nocardia speluncae]